MAENNKKSNLTKIILGGVLVVIALQLYIMLRPSSIYVQPTHTEMSKPTSGGQVTAVTAQPAAPTVNTQDIPAAFHVGGRISQLFFAEHAQVRKGDILAKLDTAPFEKSITSARARLQAATAQDMQSSTAPNPNFTAIETARANLDADQRTLDLARDDLEKRKAQQVSGRVDNIYLDDVQNAHDAEVMVERRKRELAQQEAIGREQQGVSGYKAAMQIARGSLTLAESELADTKLLSPADGTISERRADVGALVGANDTVFVISVIQP